MDHGVDLAARARVEERLGYAFEDSTLLTAALTHSSAANENGGHNETLEFLGDAVLGLVVGDLLFVRWPEADEGRLSRRRAALVNAKALAAEAEKLELGPALCLGRGEEKTGGRAKISILAGAYEAVVGAVYRDGGFEAARGVVVRAFAEEIDRPVDDGGDEGLGDWKTLLQERTQREFRCTPSYLLLRSTGPDHAKDFESRVELGGRILGTGRGSSKKTAEQAAAREALARLDEEEQAAAKRGSA